MSDPASWLRLAREDLRMAEWAQSEAIHNQACFHAQQCAEKAVKAWLAHTGITPPRIHQLTVLVSLLPHALEDEDAAGLMLLDRFYVPTRYPDALPGSLEDGLPDESDAVEAVTTARAVLTTVVRVIEGPGDG
jgi:HEPN domain-containing protein